MLNNFTGEHNSWIEIIDLLNAYVEEVAMKATEATLHTVNKSFNELTPKVK
jgi:hypothetical protein